MISLLSIVIKIIDPYQAIGKTELVIIKSKMTFKFQQNFLVAHRLCK